MIKSLHYYPRRLHCKKYIFQIFGTRENTLKFNFPLRNISSLNLFSLARQNPQIDTFDQYSLDKGTENNVFGQEFDEYCPLPGQYRIRFNKNSQLNSIVLNSIVFYHTLF